MCFFYLLLPLLLRSYFCIDYLYIFCFCIYVLLYFRFMKNFGIIAMYCILCIWANLLLFGRWTVQVFSSHDVPLPNGWLLTNRWSEVKSSKACCEYKKFLFCDYKKFLYCEYKKLPEFIFLNITNLNKPIGRTTAEKKSRKIKQRFCFY